MIVNKKWKIVIVILIAVIVSMVFIKKKETKGGSEDFTIVTPEIGSIYSAISTTATVQPRNRLEIKPPINGRIEKILVKEGENVKAGQIVAWMSSTERAALLDAAMAQ